MVIGLIVGCLVDVVAVVCTMLGDMSRVILANIVLLEDGCTTKTCSSISNKINLR
jgi:hypothetical protein